MVIAIACDHAGFSLKKNIVRTLRQHKILDLGAHGSRPVDYPDYAEKVCKAVISGKATRGILVCGSGAGVAIAANKFPGIRAAVCHDAYTARQSVEHNNANILCVGARIIGEEFAKEVVAIFLGSKFSREPKHVRRVGKIEAIEKRFLR